MRLSVNCKLTVTTLLFSLQNVGKCVSSLVTDHHAFTYPRTGWALCTRRCWSGEWGSCGRPRQTAWYRRPACTAAPPEPNCPPGREKKNNREEGLKGSVSKDDVSKSNRGGASGRALCNHSHNSAQVRLVLLGGAAAFRLVVNGGRINPNVDNIDRNIGICIDRFQ